MKNWFNKIRNTTLIWGLGVFLIGVRGLPFFYELGVGFFIAWLLRRRTVAVSLVSLLLVGLILFFVFAISVCVDVCGMDFNSAAFDGALKTSIESKLSAKALNSFIALVISIVITSLLLRRFSKSD